MGLSESHFRRVSRAAMFALFAVAAPAAWAAAPASIDTPAAEADGDGPPTVHALDTEIVVHDWVLCVSQAFAEKLALARAEGADEASAAYADLSRNHSCGRFDELYVILRQRLYVSPRGSEHDTRVFAAEVRFADSWGSAFIVYGGLPDGL